MSLTFTQIFTACFYKKHSKTRKCVHHELTETNVGHCLNTWPSRLVSTLKNKVFLNKIVNSSEEWIYYENAN